MALTPVPVAPLPAERFREILSPEALARFERTIDEGRELLSDRVLWNVNSTARGGGVAELLISLVAYVRGAGLDARWIVIGGDPDFFRVTKRIHNRLHGFEGDGESLGDGERETYERALAGNAAELAEIVRPGDVVLLHDPQTAGLTEPLKARGATVVWRCHVGLDVPNEYAREAWRFLRPYVAGADAYVFSREAFVWEDLDAHKLAIIAPSIDAFAPKNADMSSGTVTGVLAAAGVLDAQGGGGPGTFTRVDGSPGRVDRHVEATQARMLQPSDLVLAQVSRWDRLKDPAGVIEAFAAHVSDDRAHLLLAGPSTAAVSDDPEGAQVAADAIACRAGLAAAVRDRVHLVSLPMDDPEENAAIVNAIQRRADVVAQKSLAEGFGLTVAEARWKGRPVIASRVGGIQDQIVDGESGVLVDPTDLDAFGRAAAELLADTERAERLGAAARERVRDRFLGPRTLGQYLDLSRRLLAGDAPAA
ncbi:MAG: trehalose synthase [Gaiellales bacterium]|nr:trehalose synthase [Gaiellales bacterium]